ncbi:fibroblast growth factor-binding protein 1-like [Melanotaenia boesemani]|uniref:fibroblast growth factor-binding protein 1-like n=1 Tax=Melanotaenia boesemani TaxID=1250792 RepID=UPI001C04A22A|nr:fibroblast growth factor-binding protein 1-like [Melanotaenia boesemani]
MVLLKSFTLWLLLGFLEQQVAMTSAGRAANKTSSRAQRNGDKIPATARGRFSTSDKLQCSWNGREDKEAVKLWVTCKNPEARTASDVTNLECEYNAKPQSCPGYQSETKGFWKQVGRALKKMQNQVCRNKLALVKTGMCKRTSGAHFKLDVNTIIISPQSEGPGTHTPPPLPSRLTTVGPTPCTKRADHRKTAEEYCSSSWASVCSFFLSMLQSDDC